MYKGGARERGRGRMWGWGRPAGAAAGAAARSGVPTVHVLLDATECTGALMSIDATLGALMKRRDCTEFRSELVYVARQGAIMMDLVDAHDQAEVIVRQSSSRRITLPPDATREDATAIICYLVGMCIASSGAHDQVLVYSSDARLPRSIQACGEPIIPVHIYSSSGPFQGLDGEPTDRGGERARPAPAERERAAAAVGEPAAKGAGVRAHAKGAGPDGGADEGARAAPAARPPRAADSLTAAARRTRMRAPGCAWSRSCRSCGSRTRWRPSGSWR